MKDTNHIENIEDKIPEDELNELRGRMSSLRERLNSQQLVTDRLLREVVKSSTDYSRRHFKLEKFLIVPIGVLSMIHLYYTMHLPLWYVIFTVVMLSWALYVDWRTQRLSSLDYGSTPLLEIQERLVKQKRLRARRMLSGMIMLAIWLALGVYAISVVPLSPEDALHYEEYITGLCVGAIVGGVIGLWIGFSAYFRMQRESEQAIRRLQDFTEK